ncbi:MAG: phage tail tape measure protein [Atribacterota bacterium]|nr:phage tail tape measure protein [Atribacterota bacterium]
MAQERLSIYIDGDASKAKQAFQTTDQSLNKLMKNFESAAAKMKSIGLKMSLAVTAPLILIGKQSLDTAMDVIESENLFEVSMGNMADSAREWSKELRYQLGLNEYEVRKQVGTYTVMLKSMGLGEQAAYDMAKGMVQLAYDMASFYNLKPEEAFDKLSSGIVGMPRPLQDLGILVNESTVQLFAYKNGIAEVGAELTESEKVLARYGAIMERTSAAQGDMARTLESPANQLRIFNEQVNMLKADLGQQLIPIFQDVIDILEPAVKWFSTLNDEQKGLIIRFGIVAAAIGPVLLLFGNMVTMVSSLTKGIFALNAATLSLEATTAPLVAAYTSLAAILLSLAKGLNNVTLGFGNAASGARSFWSVLKELIQVITLYPPYYGKMLSNLFGGNKQVGGVVHGDMFANDLGIPLVKDEAIIPAPIVRAIKENRGSFAGIGDSNNAVNLTINMNNAVIREEKDINKFADAVMQRAYELTQIRGRLA